MSANAITSPSLQVISRHPFADVMQNPESGQKSLHATIAFAPGDQICSFKAANTQSYATYLTVQTGVNVHITLDPEFLQYINHSCEPSVFFDTTTMKLICLKPLQAGDELTFFYPSTEWDMAQSFLCTCGSPACLQLVNGASRLSTETLRRYKLTDFITGKARQNNLL